MKTLLVVLVGLLALAKACEESTCKGDCRCMSEKIPGGLPVDQTPQLVMLTFDDTVNAANYETYKPLFLGNYKNPGGPNGQCNIGATFFVSHEYCNYAELHHLYRSGNEIAVHSITHEANTEMWKKAPAERWVQETKGMRDIIAKFAQIPASQINGFRAPFLQTAGNVTFQVLKDQGFLYDSSMATLEYAGINGDAPIWPYTLDHKFPQDCIIQPCPNQAFPGLWEVPLVSFFKRRVMIDGEEEELSPCAMADACIPWPETKEETYDYFMENFNRHFLSNRSPLPVFLHESWLKDEARKQGYIQFVQELVKKPEVFLVTVQDAIAYIKNPVPLSQYQQKRCITTKASQKCTAIGKYCNFPKTQLGGPRAIFVCGSACPNTYPWLGTPL